MAFPSASGYSNLPNGNFSPVIYSQKVQKAFRKSSVVEDITNTDYMGEIANYGDSVRIIKEPEITVSDYKRGTTVAAQDLSDADFSLVVDQANYFMFKVDDIEAAHSHVNFMDLATDRAAYRLSDTFDQEVLGYLSGYVRNTANTAWIVNASVNGTKADSSAGSDELLVANKLDITDFGGSDLGGTEDAPPKSLINSKPFPIDKISVFSTVSISVASSVRSPLKSNSYRKAYGVLELCLVTFAPCFFMIAST